MKKNILVMGGIILVVSLAIVGQMGIGHQESVVTENYTNIQEQGEGGEYNSPVIQDTMEKVESAIVG